MGLDTSPSSIDGRVPSAQITPGGTANASVGAQQPSRARPLAVGSPGQVAGQAEVPVRTTRPNLLRCQPPSACTPAVRRSSGRGRGGGAPGGGGGGGRCSSVTPTGPGSPPPPPPPPGDPGLGAGPGGTAPGGNPHAGAAAGTV